jgi:hypothetical protein
VAGVGGWLTQFLRHELGGRHGFLGDRLLHSKNSYGGLVSSYQVFPWLLDRETHGDTMCALGLAIGLLDYAMGKGVLGLSLTTVNKSVDFSCYVGHVWWVVGAWRLVVLELVYE